MELTGSNVINIIGLLFGAIGIMWKVQASGTATREIMRKELKEAVTLFFVELNKLEVKIDASALKIAGIAIESKYVREDHDDLVRLSKDVEKNTKDIGEQHGKIRQVYQDVNTHVLQRS